MNLENFISELNGILQENKIMKEKLELIQKQVDFTFKETDKEIEFSRTYLMMCGIAKQLQDILDR